MPHDGDLPDLAKAGPCRKGCGKELGAMAGPRNRHERKCDGTPKKAPPREKSAAAAEPRPARRSRPAVRRSKGSPFAGAIDELRGRRQAAIDKAIAEIPEVQEIDELIGKLEAMETK